MTPIFLRFETGWGGNMCKKGKKGKIEKNCPKIWDLEIHDNKSKIGKEGQDCMTTIFWRSETRWSCNMSKKGKGRVKKKH